MAITLTTVQTVNVEFAAGVTFPNPPTWQSDTPSVAAVVPTGIGVTATIAAVGVGSANINVSGMSIAGVTYTGVIAVSVISGGPVTASIIPGIPQ